MILRFYIKPDFIFFAMTQSANMKSRQGMAWDVFTAKPDSGSAELSLSSVVQQQSQLWCEWAEIPQCLSPAGLK